MILALNNHVSNANTTKKKYEKGSIVQSYTAIKVLNKTLKITVYFTTNTVHT